tara:strand:+ start:815 stop:1063 length:249 start_codon:yes stop_codon:yes gene_type:complete
MLKKTNINKFMDKLDQRNSEAIKKKFELIKKVKAWLEHEVKENDKYTYDDYDGFDDLDVYLFRGRSECASGLLEQIKKWENE